MAPPGFQFGLVIRGQAEPGEDIARRFQETLALVRLADVIPERAYALLLGDE